MSRAIDLNADLGEGMPFDRELMALISSCSIACGGHAGDETSMRKAVREARAAGVKIGAHPSYPDRENFGRQVIDLSKDELSSTLKRQIDGLRMIAAEEGAEIAHVKPHGALYNASAAEPDLASLVVETIRSALPGAALYGPPRSELAACAEAVGMRFIAEGFVDRAYRTDGSLVPRSDPDAIIREDSDRVDQALRFARGSPIDTKNGPALHLRVETLCLHGDTEGALATAKAVRNALAAERFAIEAPDG